MSGVWTELNTMGLFLIDAGYFSADTGYNQVLIFISDTEVPRLLKRNLAGGVRER